MGTCTHKIQKHPSSNDNTQTADSYKRTTTAKETYNDNLDNFEDFSPSKIYKRGSMRKSKSGIDVSNAIKEEELLQHGNSVLARCCSEKEKCERKKERRDGSGQFSSTEDSTENACEQVIFGERNAQNEELSALNIKAKKYEQSFEIPRNSMNLESSAQNQNIDKNRTSFYNNETPLPTVMELSIEQIDSALLRSGTNRSSIKKIGKNEEVYVGQNNITAIYHKNQPNPITIRSK